MSTKTIWTIKEAATFARVSQATIRRMIATGKLESFRVGRSIRIHQTAMRSIVGVGCDAT